jgi:ribosomal protein S5
MRATIEIDENVLTARLLNKALKDERLFHALIIIGQADGTLVYRDAAGKLHVVHGTGPQAKEALRKATEAARQIIQGVETLTALGEGMP